MQRITRTIDWYAIELRHDGCMDEDPPTAEEQAQIDAEATAAVESAERIFAEYAEIRRAESL